MAEVPDPSAGQQASAVNVDPGSLDVRLVGDLEGEFFVPSYQRGYRWTDVEVRALLDDIRASDNDAYYLQPIVVKARGDGSWELVDGQQRLTTLYLALRYIRDNHIQSADPAYSITYETRPGSKAYLEGRSDDDPDANVDFFYMHRVHACIEEWFEQWGHRTPHEAMQLFDALHTRVRVIWYEAPPDVDARDLFTRLNVGRIPLTDAELVKALLLRHGRGEEGRTDASLQMAAHWDLIERDLRNPDVWTFVTGNASEEATHIDLLLDTIAGGVRGHDRPLFHTFESLRKEITDSPHEFWRKVVELHSVVLGWYDDLDLFHKIGYLAAVGRSFGELVEKSQNKGRSAFAGVLDESVRRHLRLSADDVADLTYGTRKSADVLLLMNVETVRRMSGSSARYSFVAHAAGDWSIEHIHAQNAEPLTTAAEQRSWLEYHQRALRDLPDVAEDVRMSLDGRIEEALDTGLTTQSFRVLESEIAPLFSPPGDASGSDIHDISNLALLDSGANSALSNSVFAVKRQQIIKRDKHGAYIPICTRNVFLKYYTPYGEQQLHFWSKADRHAYLEEMLRLVGPYLTDGEDEP